MAKIRAYRLAEELGIDRNEIVERAALHGVVIKNAMASMEDAEVQLLREKIGGATRAKRSMDVRRLEGKGGNHSHTEAHCNSTKYVGIVLPAVKCNHNKCNQARNIDERNVYLCKFVCGHEQLGTPRHALNELSISKG